MDSKSLLPSFFAGSLAGASGIIIGHPLDTLKVRLQVGKTLKNVNLDRATMVALYRGKCLIKL